MSCFKIDRRLVHSESNGEVVLRDPSTADWIRILKNRTYVERLVSERPP